MEIFLSIVIPVYRIRETYLRQCFNSLIAQDMREFRVIIIDDGSPDSCGEICDEYARMDSRFVVYHQENQGVSAARNLGLSVINTEWVVFIDADDWVEPDFVSALYRVKEAVNADIYLYDYYQEFVKTRKQRQLQNHAGKITGELLSAIRKAPFNHLVIDGHVYDYEVIVVWNKMYRSSLLKRKNMAFIKDADKGQDAIFNAEILQYSENLYYVHRFLYHYRYTEESITNRFSPNIRAMNEIMFQNLKHIIATLHLPEEYRQAHYARISTILYSYMRLYYFHPNNNMKDSQIYEELDQILSSEPYKEAIEKAHGAELTLTQKIFLFFLKRRNYKMLRFLIHCRHLVKNAQGYRIQQRE